MSSASSHSSAGGACRTEYKRQKTFMKNEKTATKDPSQKEDTKDPLPIVELKPFVKKVWRRENSLPGFYDRFPPSKPSNQVRKRKDLENRQDAPPSPTPSPDKLEMFIGNMQTENAQRRQTSGMHSPRSRQKLHPSAEAIAPKQKEHSQSLVPGFITRVERSKSTLMEIHDAEAPSKIQCGLQQSLDRKELDHPPIIDLKGERGSKDPVKRVTRHASMSPYRNMYHKNTVCHYSVPQAYGNDTKILSNKYPRRNSADRPKTPFYDAFDRKGTLPSIQIGMPTIRKRPVKSRGPFEESERMLDNAMPLHVSAHKVGGISNSLHLLSKFGAPTMVEKQLTFQLEIDLRRFRRSRDYFPFDMTPSELARFYPPQTVNLTNGEKLLQRGMEMNARKKKTLRDKSHKSAPDKLETIHDGMTPRETEGIITRIEGELFREDILMEDEDTTDMLHDANVISVPNSNTQNLVNSMIDVGSKPPDICEPNSLETKNSSGQTVRNSGHHSEGPVLKIATAQVDENDTELECTARTDSPGDSSDIIQNVLNANALSDTKDMVPNGEEVTQEEPEGISRSSTFLTSEHNKGLLQDFVPA